MKTPLLYGFAMALAGALLWLGLYFSGLHDTPQKLNTAQIIALVVGVTITVVCLALAMREKRANSSPENDWGYGSAFGVGVLTVAIGTLFGLVTNYLYPTLINPNFQETVVQAQIAAMEAKGMSASQIAGAEPMIRKFTSPVISTIIGGVVGLCLGVVLALIVAIFYRKRDEIAPAVPPTLA